MKRMIDSELIEALGTDIKFDGKGNVKVGKNLEVGGTTKLNGGLKPIHTYTWSITQDGMNWDYTIETLYETQEGLLGYTIFNGYLRIHVDAVGVNQDYAIIGEYYAYEGQINELNGITFGGYPAMSIIDGTSLQLFSYNSTTNKATFTDYQPKLYRHIIYLSGTDSNSNTYSGYIIVESPSNLEVSTSQDLTTLLNPTDGFEYPLSGVVYKQNIDYVTELVPIQVIQFESSNWKFYSTDNQADISTFRDTVTSL